MSSIVVSTSLDASKSSRKVLFVTLVNQQGRSVCSQLVMQLADTLSACVYVSRGCSGLRLQQGSKVQFADRCGKVLVQIVLRCSQCTSSHVCVLCLQVMGWIGATARFTTCTQAVVQWCSLQPLGPSPAQLAVMRHSRLGRWCQLRTTQCMGHTSLIGSA